MGDAPIDYRTGAPVLGTLLDPDADAQARSLSLALAEARNAPVRFLSPTDVAEESPARRAVERLAGGDAVAAAEVVADSRPPEQVVLDHATDVRAGLVTIQRQPAESAGVSIRRDTTARIVAGSPTDVAVANGRGDLDSVASILVPIAGGPHTELAVEVATALARASDAWVELFHVVPEDADAGTRSAGADRLADARGAVGDYEEFDTWLYEAADPAAAIAEQSAYYDAVVMGAPTKGRMRRFVFGSTVDTVDREVEVPVVTTHQR